jgi:NAD(P)-dependent dehydrogenase (short-subunit alcohol dehydrogenase family)
MRRQVVLLDIDAAHNALHAVDGITKTASLEWSRRVLVRRSAQHAFAAHTSSAGFGSAEQMARLVVFLASGKSLHLPGHALLADGGYLIA